MKVLNVLVGAGIALVMLLVAIEFAVGQPAHAPAKPHVRCWEDQPCWKDRPANMR